MGNVYTVDRLTKKYPGQAQPANDDISLHIRAGEIFGLLGDNGAGKSTLVRQMVNLLRPTAGVITLYGRPIDTQPGRVPRLVGYMPQESLALNNLTVGEALYFTAHLRGLTRADARRERDRLLDLWELGPLRGRYSSRLSGGQRRLLRLAVALAGRPPVAILDEPTNDLDPARRKLVWGNLRQENARRGTTILFITHDAIEAEKAIQRVGIMRAGRLVAVGRPSELKRRLAAELRLELHFDPARPPQLPAGLTPAATAPGHWTISLHRRDASAVMAALDWSVINDFRLASATLEDLYLHYATA